MSDKVKIAIDTMSGENSPKKIIEGIEISLKSNQENFFYLYGKKDLLEKEIYKKKYIQKYSEIIHTEDIILDDESPLTAAKKSKNTSMWKAIESLKEKKSHISLSSLLLNFASELYESNIDNLFNEFFKFLVIKFAVPSAVFNAIFPVNPSVTITSTFPSII